MRISRIEDCPSTMTQEQVVDFWREEARQRLVALSQRIDAVESKIASEPTSTYYLIQKRTTDAAIKTSRNEIIKFHGKVDGIAKMMQKYHWRGEDVGSREEAIEHGTSPSLSSSNEKLTKIEIPTGTTDREAVYGAQASLT